MYRLAEVLRVYPGTAQKSSRFYLRLIYFLTCLWR